MARKRIIDLRNSDTASHTPPSSAYDEEEGRSIPITAPAPNKKVLLQWSAPEYRTPELMPYWYVLPGAVALALAVLGIAIQSFFFTTFVVLAFIVIVMYAKRTPHEIHCVVSPRGIFVGRAFHDFRDIKSFAIFEEEAAPELSLEVDRMTTAYLRVPLGDMHPNRIRAVLSDFLSEERHKDILSDQIARSFGF